MKTFSRYAVFFVIGVIPHALAGVVLTDWRWWATCVPLWVSIWLRDYYGELYCTPATEGIKNYR